MSANLGLLAVVAVLYACGVYLLLERSLTRLLLGVLLLGNATNLLLLTSGGSGGGPPIVGRSGDGPVADPLVQALILTAIVITMGLTAFFLALTYRAFVNSRAEEVQDDPEAAAVARRTGADAPDRDRSDDPATGADTAAGDRFGPDGSPT
ncbi:Na(+)/H(+) antiporter subunit C [Rhodococcus aerolatus]